MTDFVPDWCGDHLTINQSNGCVVLTCVRQPHPSCEWHQSGTEPAVLWRSHPRNPAILDLSVKHTQGFDRRAS